MSGRSWESRMFLSSRYFLKDIEVADTEYPPQGFSIRCKTGGTRSFRHVGAVGCYKFNESSEFID